MKKNSSKVRTNIQISSGLKEEREEGGKIAETFQHFEYSVKFREIFMGPSELHIISQVQPIRANDYVPT